MAIRLFQELTRDEARTLAESSVALLPTGATEQHGPHLPVGTDSLAVEYIAHEAARLASTSVVVTPTLPFGSSSHHLPFGGTMSVSTETYYRLVLDLAKSLIIGGWKRIFILNGHGGNNELIQLVVRDLALEYEADLAAASYWVASWHQLVAGGAGDLGRLPGHAGAFETSLVMALRGELVRAPLPHRDGAAERPGPSFYPPVRTERHGSWQAINGYSDSPDRASKEDGARFLRIAAERVALEIDAFSNATRKT